MVPARFPRARGIDRKARRAAGLTGRGILRRMSADSPFRPQAMGPVAVTMQASQEPGARSGSGPAGPISIQGVHKHFGAVQAVRGLDLTIGLGEVVAFLGPNGAGKTTTIDMILGLARPDEGTVRVFGRTPDESVARGELTAVLQNGGLLKDFKGGGAVRYF